MESKIYLRKEQIKIDTIPKGLYRQILCYDIILMVKMDVGKSAVVSIVKHFHS